MADLRSQLAAATKRAVEAEMLDEKSRSEAEIHAEAAAQARAERDAAQREAKAYREALERLVLMEGRSRALAQNPAGLTRAIATQIQAESFEAFDEARAVLAASYGGAGT